MPILDLTHAVCAGMPVYPGTEPPRLVDAWSIEGVGFAEKRLTLFSHTGTHVDAPAHIIQGGATIDQFPVDRFRGKGCLLDVRPLSGRDIDRAMVSALNPRIRETDFVLLRSGWSDRWGDKGYFRGYPVLTREAARWMAQFGLKGIGVDMISVDTEDTVDFPIHRIFLSRNILIIENLTNLASLPPRMFDFWCMPLKIEGGDGSPIRAAAVYP